MRDNNRDAGRATFNMRALAIVTLGELARDPKTSISARHSVAKKLAEIAGSADPDAAEAAAQLALIQNPKSRGRRN